MDVTGTAWRTSNHPDGPQLAFPADIWQAFTDHAKAGS
jgi:hypothetical protein